MEELRPEDLAFDPHAEQSSSEHSFEFIQLEQVDGVATLTLKRPPANYLHVPMLNEILEALNSLTFQPGTRILLIRSDTKSFCAGLSPEAMKEDSLFVSVDLFHRIFRTLITMNTLSIVEVNGPAYGTGAAMALAADMIVAGQSARFGHPEIRYGHFTPAAAYLYSRTLTRTRAAYLILSGDAIEAKTAAAWGLVTWVVPDEKLRDTTDKLITRLKNLSGPALEFARRTLAKAMFPDWDEIFHELEDLYLVQLASTEDAREGIRAWLERRKPEWKHM